MQINCPICNKTFYVNKKRASAKVNCCSMKCRTKYLAENYSGLNFGKFERNLNKKVGKKQGRLLVTKDYTKELIGHILVGGRSYEKYKYHVRCICDCGNVKMVSWWSLTNKAKSCGCLAQETSTKLCKNLPRKKSLPTQEKILKKHFNSYRWRAMNKKIEFALTKEDFNEIVRKNCHYCGQSPKFNNSTPAETFNGIDRKDNKIGYNQDNSLPCCTICNFLKKDYDYYAFLNLIEKINKNRGIMSKTKNKNHNTESQYMKEKIRELEKENRQLRRELQYHKKNEHIFNDKEKDEVEPEEETVIETKRIKCTSCGKGTYDEFEIMDKVFGTCNVCGERKKLK